MEAKRALAVVIGHPEFDETLNEADVSKKDLENARRSLDTIREDKKNPFARR